MASPTNPLNRIPALARDWHLTVEASFETETSVISFVTRKDQRLVLKVIKRKDDEWRAGQVLSAFDCHGVVRVYEHTEGAMLLERLYPANNLAGLALNGEDERATEIIGDVMERMAAVDSAVSSSDPSTAFPTIEDWGKGFSRYLATKDGRIPLELVESAQGRFADLCLSQSRKRLLHGDLQHYNVLFDSQRGWLAIDPKGVIGELEYEIGAVLRNPIENPNLFLSPRTIQDRIDRLTRKLKVNGERVLGWAFSQAVLSAIWLIEDGSEVSASTSAVRLANVMRPMLSAH